MGLRAKLIPTATGGALALAPAASGTSNGGACSVSATATFSQPLSLTSGRFSRLRLALLVSSG